MSLGGNGWGIDPRDRFSAVICCTGLLIFASDDDNRLLSSEVLALDALDGASKGSDDSVAVVFDTVGGTFDLRLIGNASSAGETFCGLRINSLFTAKDS